LPESTVEDEARKGRTYWRTWAEQGWLDIVPGDTIRHSFIRDEIRALVPRFTITEFGFDPAHANLLAGELSDDGHQMVEVRQGPITMSEPSKLFEALVYSRKVRATGRPGGPNPVLRWMIGNAVAHVGRTGLIQPDKAKARGKIDGVVAAITALSRVVGGESIGDYQGESLTFV
jgi:phage terminase large subunit-like protein